MKFSNTFPPQHNSSHQQTSWSYDQTATTHNSIHSQYQAGSLPGLPSARVWPDSATIPSQKKLDHDLLGLNQNTAMVDYSAYPASKYSMQNRDCPYHRPLYRQDFIEETSGRGLGGLDRFLAEAPSFQGAMYFGDNVSYRASPCCCLDGF